MAFACKTATLGPELEVTMGPRLTCRFVHEKQRDYHKYDKSIWFPALTCCFVHAKQGL